MRSKPARRVGIVSGDASVAGRLRKRVLQLEQELERKSRTLREANSRFEQANRRTREELLGAARMQQALLPPPGLTVPGVDLAWNLRPCDELAGDLLNCFRLDERNLAFYVLDVSGHGVSSALLSVQVSRLMTPIMSDSSLLKEPVDRAPWYRLVEPTRVAARLNEIFQTTAGVNKYFTLLYGLLELDTGRVQLVSAGHPGPVRVPRWNSPTSIRLCGRPIGLFDDSSFEESEFVLEPGERIWLYSDGIVEATNEQDQEFGLRGLERRLDELREPPLTQAVLNVIASVERWTGAAGPDDDCSLLALEWRGAVRSRS
jgi:sigma-B regulation protein RsbU (phosphoserine phosphatase)